MVRIEELELLEKLVGRCPGERYAIPKQQLLALITDAKDLIRSIPMSPLKVVFGTDCAGCGGTGRQP